MAEYIEREAAIESAKHAWAKGLEPSQYIETIPAADVAQVRYGRWLDVQETDMYVPDLKFTATKTAETCSACRARIGFIGPKMYLFDAICPSCGARMDGDD